MPQIVYSKMLLVGGRGSPGLVVMEEALVLNFMGSKQSTVYWMDIFCLKRRK